MPPVVALQTFTDLRDLRTGGRRPSRMFSEPADATDVTLGP